MLEGELTVMRDGRRSMLHAGESAHIEPGVWHDWWNEAEADAIVRVEITPGERFVHMIETLFGLAREGTSTRRACRNPLQLALTAQEFSDVIVFRKPPRRVQRIVFGALAPIATTARLPRHLPEPLAYNAGAPAAARHVPLTIQVSVPPLRTA